MMRTFWASRRHALMAAMLLAARPSFAAKMAVVPVSDTRDGVTTVTRDLTPRFLEFVVAAQGMKADARFLLWQDRYDFAAVPPTPAGDLVARRLLDAAWTRYEAVLPTIRAGAAGMQPNPLDVAIAVADLLEAPRPLKIGTVAYVGGFEVNAFTAGGADGPVVSLPVEIPAETRQLLAPHELTHAVHIIVADLSPSY